MWIEEIVVMQEDGLVPTKWLLVGVIEVNTRKGGLVQAVIVRMNTETYKWYRSSVCEGFVSASHLIGNSNHKLLATSLTSEYMRVLLMTYSIGVGMNFKVGVLHLRPYEAWEPLGGSGACSPGKVWKLDPLRCILVQSEHSFILLSWD